MLGNMYHLKKKLAPNWYENGSPTIFSPEQIAEWESSQSGKEVLTRMETAANTPEDVARFLDTIKARDSEQDWKEVMHGTSERPDND